MCTAIKWLFFVTPKPRVGPEFLRAACLRLLQAHLLLILTLFLTFPIQTAPLIVRFQADQDCSSDLQGSVLAQFLSGRVFRLN